jgi:hypothetical protein
MNQPLGQENIVLLFQVRPKVIGPLDAQSHREANLRRARCRSWSKCFSVSSRCGPRTAGRSNSASSGESVSAGSSRSSRKVFLSLALATFFAFTPRMWHRCSAPSTTRSSPLPGHGQSEFNPN